MAGTLCSDTSSRGSDIIELVLAESYPVLLEGIERLFKSTPGFAVMACCGNGGEALRAVRRYRPHLLVLDLRISGKNALEVLREVRAESSAASVVLYADEIKQDEVLQVIQDGAQGIVLKSMPSHLLIQCVQKVHRGATWVENQSAGPAIDRLIRQNGAHREISGRLSRREFEVLRMVFKGHSNREIADKLAVCEGTIKSHLHHVYEKLELRGRLELVLYARDKGLLSDPPPLSSP